MMGYPSAQELAEHLVCVGLANNFAALRAMAIEGIQKGHMNLHAKNIALAAGVPQYLSMDAVEYMKRRGRINKDSAKAFLTALDLYTELRTEDSKKNSQLPQNLSTFFLEFSIPALNEPIVLNIALESYAEKPIHISIEKEDITKLMPEDLNVRKKLFGDKGYEWLYSFFRELDLIRYAGAKGTPTDEEVMKSKYLCYKLKLLSILINLVAYNLVQMNYEKANQIFNMAKTDDLIPKVKKLLQGEDGALCYGFLLLIELTKIFEYNIEINLPFPNLRPILLSELYAIPRSHLVVYQMWQEAKQKTNFDFQKFLDGRRKRLCATMMLFCDSLILKSTELNENLLDILQKLGEIYEIECTLVRDLTKWTGSSKDANLYSYWLMTKGEFMNGEKDSLKLAFAKEVSEIANKLKVELFKGLDPSLIHQYKVTRSVIKHHYEIHDKYFPESEDPKPSL